MGLYLGDLDYCIKEQQVKDHLVDAWEVLNVLLDRYDILLAYEHVGSWGCDSSGFYILKDKKTKELYEVHGSHDSTCGFEGQFELEKTSIEFLMKENYIEHLTFGGYDDDVEDHKQKIQNFLNESFGLWYCIDSLEKNN